MTKKVAVRWNNYDKLMLGVSLYNTMVPVRPFHYKISPVYAFDSNQLTGSGQISYTFFKNTERIRALRLGLYAKTYNYNQSLNYTCLSPTINIDFRKKYARSPNRHSLRIRNVYVDREQPSYGNDGIVVQLENSRYGVLDLRYVWDHTDVLRPFSFTVDQQISSDFGRLSAEMEYRIMMSNKNRFSLRFFAGTMLWNSNRSSESFYNFGMSGTQDYLFDYYFFGRSDTSGILSQQFFTTEGGFKTQISSFSDQYILSTNLRLPVWKILGLYADLGYNGGSNKSTLQRELWFYGSGIKLRLIEDFFEIYFPLIDQDGWKFVGNYAVHIRFVMDLINIDHMVRKASRSFY